MIVAPWRPRPDLMCIREAVPQWSQPSYGRAVGIGYGRTNGPPTQWLRRTRMGDAWLTEGGHEGHG